MLLTILYVAVSGLSGLKSNPGAAKAAHTPITMLAGCCAGTQDRLREEMARVEMLTIKTIRGPKARRLRG
jgi:hypothetical protein